MVRSVIALCSGIACLALSTPAAPAQSMPGISAVTVSSYTVNGVAIKKYMPSQPNGTPPVVLVHGGAHGKWIFDRYARLLSEAGYECHALDWLNHGNSIALPQSTFLNRGILDITHREIRDVVNRLGRAPILIGHSMGGLAALAYATENPSNVVRLVLLTPVVTASVGAPPIDLPIDWSQPVGPFPYDVAKQFFYPALDEPTARAAHAQLVGESPRAVWEATRWTINVGLHALTAPTLVIATEDDVVTPPSAVNGLANLIDADYLLVPNIGHGDVLLKEPEATQTVGNIRNWLTTS